MSKLNDDIVSIFNSRINIASMLEYQGYDISDYEGMFLKCQCVCSGCDYLLFILYILLSFMYICTYVRPKRIGTWNSEY